MPSERIDSRAHRVLAGVSRVAVLEALRASPRGLDAQAIAEKVGLHANTVRSHLDQLVEAGLVASSVQPRTTPGRPRLLFTASAPTGVGPGDSYELLAGILASSIDASAPAPGEVAAQAGRRWGRQVAQTEAGTGPVDAGRTVGGIVALLDDVGFAPALRDASGAASTASGPVAAVIELHRCPFYDVARAHPEVVCAVHLGLLQGALEQMQAPAAVRLEPFVRPDLCLVHLAQPPTDTGEQT